MWNAVLAVYELEEHELALLREIVRTVDTLSVLDATIRREGHTYSTDAGPRVHPAVIEARQQRQALARLQTALRLPEDEHDTGEDRRPQRRGVRGFYGPRSVS